MKKQEIYNSFVKKSRSMLLISASLLAIGALFYSASFINGIKNTQAQSVGIPVIWTDIVNVVVGSDNSITKNAPNNWGNSGSASFQKFSGDGGVEFTASQIGKHIIVGLSNVNADADYASIGYAIFMHASRQVHILENGIDKGIFGGLFQIGDVFKIERVGSTIYYKKNNAVFYTSLTPSSASLIVDTSIYSNGGKVSDAKLFGNSISICQNHSIFGQALSDNFGFISFSCKNDHNEAVSGTQESPIDYGVDIGNDGVFSGYAWNDGFGWVTFNKSDLSGCPESNQSKCETKLSGNKIIGWARVLSYGDGWDGWISFSGKADDGTDYGVVLNGNNFEKYAWEASDINGKKIGIGWINLAGVALSSNDPPVITLTANPMSMQAGNDSTLAWTSSGATSCDGTNGISSWPGPKALSGSEVSGPHTIDTTYTITCVNLFGVTASKSVIITILPPPQCSNGLDDDNDGLKDEQDPDCYGPGGYDPNDNNESGSIGLTQCFDTLDNDSDGKIDYGTGPNNDPDCSSPIDNNESGNGSGSAQCSDGVDNDDPEDTLADTKDPGCYDGGAYSPSDDYELDTLPQCSNFFDDDGDGKIDYKTDGTGDPGCSSADDNREFNIIFEEF